MKASELMDLIKPYQDHDDISFEQMKLIFGEESKFDIRKFYKKINVLDHGFVELIDGPAEDPRLKIVNAARVSFAKESKELSEKDEKLVNFLFDSGHFSTFRHSYFTFRIKAPLFVVYHQWWKYQIGSEWINSEEDLMGFKSAEVKLPSTDWNQMSFRYVEVEPVFYIPNEIRKQSSQNKQGSFGKLEFIKNGENSIKYYEESCMLLYDRYKYLVDSGAAKEQCRGLLPPCIYSECIWTASLQTLLFFLSQRLKEDSQFEIRQYALALVSILKPLLEPLTIVKAS